MSDIKFLADGMELNLTELYDYTMKSDLDFAVEFDRLVQEYLVNNSVEDEPNNPEGYVFTGRTVLDHDDFSDYIDIDLQDVPNPWYALGVELKTIMEFASDDRNHDKTIGYLALLNDGWKWQDITPEGIKYAMVGFKGLYNDLFDVVQEMIDGGDLDPIPNYVVFDEDETAQSVEDGGHFSSFCVNWTTQAIWI